MPDYAIEVEALTKRFGAFLAVDRVSFRVERGQILGFLGPNGAGKSTTIRMLCGILEPTSGSGRVGGFDIRTEPERVKEHIGYMSQRFSLYEDLTVEENIRFYGGIYGLSLKRLRERQAWILEMAGLRGREKSLTRELSGGWKQRLALGCAVLHEPEIVFLDEPTSGVDPLSRRHFWDLIYELSDRGVTVFVTTHYLDEAEHCQVLVLIYGGRLIARGDPERLKRLLNDRDILEVDCASAVDAMKILEREPWVLETSVFGNRLHLAVEAADAAIPLVRQALDEGGIAVSHTEQISPSLEDVFIHLIEREQGMGEQTSDQSR